MILITSCPCERVIFNSIIRTIVFFIVFILENYPASTPLLIAIGRLSELRILKEHSKFILVLSSLRSWGLWGFY